MTIDELFDAAELAGLTELVITEHFDDDFPHELPVPLTFDIPMYFEAFSKWIQACPPSILLRKGIEFGYQYQLKQKYDLISQSYPFDSIILSNHLIGGVDPYFYRDCYKMPKSDLHFTYINSLADMAERCSFYDILGHYDYIVRYSPLEDPTMRYVDCPEAFDRLFKILISSEKSLEINTRTIDKLRRIGMKNSFPDQAILARYLELGGTRITLGSDSHDPSTLACHFEDTIAYLKMIGFQENTSYVNRKENRTPF
jgi:histidinol-phosphatase (PHP family)